MLYLSRWMCGLQFLERQLGDPQRRRQQPPTGLERNQIRRVVRECSLNVPHEIRRLVMLTLILGTHLGNLYSASTLVLYLNTSCSWDGGSRASTFTRTEQCSLNNVP